MKNFLILGHERSGTGYMAKLMRCFGYAVGHERVLEDGISAAQFAVRDMPTAVGPERGGENFRYVIQVVRHPLDVLASSVHTVSGPMLRKHSKYVDIPTDADPVERHLWSIVLWNELISKWQPQLVTHVEDAVVNVEGFLRMRQKWKQHNGLPPTNVNHRDHPPITVNEVMRKVSPMAWHALQLHSRVYGFSLEDAA